MAVVFAVTLIQGFFQLVGVGSVFPFLALAADPVSARESEIGASLLGMLPEMTERTLLIVAGVFSILMLFLSNGLLLLGEVVRIRYSQGLGHWLRVRMIARIIANPYSYFLHRNTGELIKKTVIDVNQMVANVLLPLLDGVSRLLTALLLLATFIFVDPVLAIAAAIGLGGFYGVVFTVLKTRRARHSMLLNVANRGSMREAQQLLGGIKPVKVHQSEAVFIDRYARHSRTQAVLQKWQPIYQNSPRYLIESLAFGGMVAAVVVLTARGQNLTSLLPQLGVMALAGYRLLPNLQTIYGSATLVSLMCHTVDEVHEEFCFDAITSPVLDVATQVKPIQWSHKLRVDQLTFRHTGCDTPLFSNLTFEILKNQFVAVVGPTGAGKSTLIDLLLGLHCPEAGQVLIDETPLTSKSIAAWRAGLGYVPQDIFLLDDTIAANIAFGTVAESIDLGRVAEVARIAQIADFIENELRDGYQSTVGERGVRLSGGQRQRIGLARALYHRPTTLILDEATSALDEKTESVLMQAIESLHGKITLVVIAHRLSTVEKADVILTVDHGIVRMEYRNPEGCKKSSAVSN
jgi:ABC-type multidrug transport system fused ATPase/permease subunit